jgi:hypothetical protein
MKSMESPIASVTRGSGDVTIGPAEQWNAAAASAVSVAALSGQQHSSTAAAPAHPALFLLGAYSASPIGGSPASTFSRKCLISANISLLGFDVTAA